MKTIFLTLYKPITTKCVSTLQKLSSLFSLRSLQRVICYVTNHAPQALQLGRVAVTSHLANVRHLVGDIFLFMGLVGFFLHQFFPEPPNDHSWYYTNWFYFIYTLRPYIVLLFWSLAVLYYWPKANKSVYIIFTVLHSSGWLGLIHYSFFVYDDKTFHTFPAWDIVLMALSFGIGLVMCADHLVYLWEHKRKGNHARFVGLAEMKGLPIEDKEPMFDELTKEYRLLNSKY